MYPTIIIITTLLIVPCIPENVSTTYTTPLPRPLRFQLRNPQCICYNLSKLYLTVITAITLSFSN